MPDVLSTKSRDLRRPTRYGLTSAAGQRQGEHSLVKKTVYLSLGSNLGDRQANLRRAIGKLMNLGDLITVSSIYETEPVELTGQPWFLNCVVMMQTELAPKFFMPEVLAI